MTTIHCEICNHKLATITDTLALPLTGAMFAPPDPWMPPPFAPEVNWEWMRCPMCYSRPFIIEGMFKTTSGEWLDIRKPGDLFWSGDTGTQHVFLAEELEATLPPAPDVAARTADSPPPPVEPPKGPTVLEEVYRMADAGMRPGEISAELAKAGVALHHVTIAQKLRGRAAHG